MAAYEEIKKKKEEEEAETWRISDHYAMKK